MTADVDAALAALLASVAEFSSAEMAAVAMFVGDEQLVVRAVTPGLETYLSRPFPVTAGSVSAEAITAGIPMTRSGPFGWQDDGLGQFVAAEVVAVPLAGRRGTPGMLYVGRCSDDQPFTDAEVAIAARFAHHAALALEMLRERDERDVLDLLEHHQMRAGLLADEALQQLYALSLNLNRLADQVPDGVAGEIDTVRARLASVSDKLRQIMTDQNWPSHDCGPLRQRLLLALADAQLGIGTEVDLRAPDGLDAITRGKLADDVAASLRELLAALHPAVMSLAVEIAYGPTAGAASGVGALSMTVSCTHPPTVSGLREVSLASVRRRARRHSGHLDVTVRVQEGWTRVLWTVPLPGPALVDVEASPLACVVQLR